MNKRIKKKKIEGKDINHNDVDCLWFGVLKKVLHAIPPDDDT